jgi:hypothetical protein
MYRYFHSEINIQPAILNTRFWRESSKRINSIFSLAIRDNASFVSDNERTRLAIYENNFAIEIGFDFIEIFNFFNFIIQC